jgi:tetratricopeptide repeat protein
MRSDSLARRLIFCAIALGAVLRISNLFDLSPLTPDERTYTTHAAAIVHDGVPGIRKLTTEYVRDTARWYPPPTRIGYTAPVAAAMFLLHRSDGLPGAVISCLASIGALIVVALIATRFVDPWVGVAGTFLLAVFPPDLIIARRAWSDALVSLLSCVLIYCSLSLARVKSRNWPALLFYAAGIIFIWTKEAAAIVWGLCALWVVCTRKLNSVRFLAGAFVAGAIGVALLAWTIGGPDVFWDIQSRFGAAHIANPYAIDYQSGPAYWLFKMFWIASPATLTLALLGLFMAPVSASWHDRRAVIGIAVFCFVFLTLPFVLPHWLNLRYASPGFGPICLLAGAALCVGVRELNNRTSALNPAVVVLLACAALTFASLRDYRYFRRSFVEADTADLAVRMMFETVGDTAIMPAPAKDYLGQSLVLFQQKRFDESIASAREALKIDPKCAAAYNNIAAAYSEKRMWDQAILAAEEALRLDPGFELAKNNLGWARDQKAKASPTQTF